MRFRAVRILLSLFLAGVVAPAACTTAGVVGGDCRDGLSVCDGVCVDLQNDDFNCGQCGRECPPDMPCAVGVCGGDLPPLDGGAGYGGAGGVGSGATAGSGNTAAAGVGGDTGSGGEGGSRCVPPFNTPSQCGSCENQCSGATPFCQLVEGEYECVPLCEPPLENCGGQCVETDSDPFHCGECFNRCPSGICQYSSELGRGVCVGAAPGHIVLMCLNYRQTYPGRSQQELLDNAVFLGPANPVRILAYNEYTSPLIEDRVRTTLDWIADDTGRSYEWFTLDSPSALASTLSIFDHEVFLVLDQDLAEASDVDSFGWSATLDNYARAGGVIIVMSGGQGVMSSFITNNDLLEVTGEQSITLDDVYNRSPGNVVGVGVVSPFRAVQDTCTFTTSASPDASLTFVVTDTNPEDGDLGAPVVVHSVVAQ